MPRIPRKVPIGPEAEAILRGQLEACRKKFGREPGPGDPIFFDPNADAPTPIDPVAMQKEVVQAMRASGAPAEIIHAYVKTGYLIVEGSRENFTADAQAEWDAAIDEYFATRLGDNDNDEN